MSDELVRRVAELAGWQNTEKNRDWVDDGKWMAPDGTLTDSGLVVLIRELLKAGWHPHFGLLSLNEGRDFQYWYEHGPNEPVPIGADTLEHATMLAYIVMKESDRG